ncbi:ABC transporter [Colletotrichum plurivorum]|uniref:ABC transporter n=1 Tax=Colletotrichum plurivorum TaxID=2175906 RepID=A0A8H6JV27_9PEZI|nr:ABC transporter [Colletotrichum plurivorum]
MPHDITFAARFRRLLELKPLDRPRAKDLVCTDGTVRFEHVYFGYGKINVLEDFNLSIASGTKVAILGPTGVRKSTIFDLLLQRSLPAKGRIFIDGQHLSGLEIASGQVGIVDQPGRLLNRSILNNLLLAKPGATLDEVRNVCRKVQIDEEIMQRPGGYDSPAGADGKNFSGGQKQKLLIARLLLQLPRIALIDEGTSALDVEVERAVKKIIDTAFSGRTVIFIAHRLSTVKNVDRIILLGENGKVLEDGTHEELLAKRGQYWRLWQHHRGK